MGAEGGAVTEELWDHGLRAVSIPGWAWFDSAAMLWKQSDGHICMGRIQREDPWRPALPVPYLLDPLTAGGLLHMLGPDRFFLNPWPDGWRVKHREESMPLGVACVHIASMTGRWVGGTP